MTWKDWGIYATMIVEGSVEAGSSSVKWDTIESDFVANQNYRFGAGSGIIQFTFGLSHGVYADIHTRGFDFSELPSGWLKTDITTGSYSGDAHWGVGYRTGYGFSYAEMQVLKKALRSEHGRAVQVDRTKRYFDEVNKSLTTRISNSSMPDVCKAYSMNVIVLAPAFVENILRAQPQTLDACYNVMMGTSLSSWGYGSRLAVVRDYLKGKDMNTNPPFSVYNYGGDPTPDPEPKPTPSGDPDKGVTELVEKKTIERQKWTLDEGHYYLKNGVLYGMGQAFKMTRMGDNFFLGIEEKEKIELVEQKKDEALNGESNKDTDNSVKPAPDNPEEGQKNIVNSFISELRKTVSAGVSYANVRPQPDPTVVHYADCSSFIGWGLRHIHPVIWNNGYLNTGTIHVAFKNAGYMRWEGLRRDIPWDKVIKGSILNFGMDASLGAGLQSHIVCVDENDVLIDCNGSGGAQVRNGAKNIIMNYYNHSHAALYYIYK